ncbi:MAG: hypothetical protein HW410_931 [Nitrosarchaeum sp.]|nr:hypothetical protein [Nitrosarchaeum sp.]
MQVPIGISVTIKLCCIDYGFECDFTSEGDIEQVIEEFGKHTNEEHGIEYTKEVLMQVILRKTR